jgi:hypothetical protein
MVVTGADVAKHDKAFRLYGAIYPFVWNVLLGARQAPLGRPVQLEEQETARDHREIDPQGQQQRPGECQHARQRHLEKHEERHRHGDRRRKPLDPVVRDEPIALAE